MTHHSNGTTGCCWLADLLARAYPQTAGVTRAALEILAGQETFSAAQVAYVAQIMFNAGALARTAGDRAELAASREANFVPKPTREQRIRLRSAAMAEQHEIAWLRRHGRPPQEWRGGTEAEALAEFGWDADRPDLPDLGPSTAQRRETA